MVTGRFGRRVLEESMARAEFETIVEGSDGKTGGVEAGDGSAQHLGRGASRGLLEIRREESLRRRKAREVCTEREQFLFKAGKRVFDRCSVASGQADSGDGARTVTRCGEKSCRARLFFKNSTADLRSSVSRHLSRGADSFVTEIAGSGLKQKPFAVCPACRQALQVEVLRSAKIADLRMTKLSLLE